MHSGRWRILRGTIGLLDLRHKLFSFGIFFCRILFQYHKGRIQNLCRSRLILQGITTRPESTYFIKIYQGTKNKFIVIFQDSSKETLSRIKWDVYTGCHTQLYRYNSRSFPGVFSPISRSIINQLPNFWAVARF